MLDFERTKQTVGGRSIMMTSWYDESQQTWRASAPAYAHLGTLFAAAHGNCTSRSAAVERLSRLLANHFEDSARK
jgi:hypothetical protein